MFLRKIEQYKKEKMPIAYVDESGFAHSMPRTHGYSRMGKRCYGSCDWNARGRKNVIAALYESSIIGCGIIEDNIDTNVFNTWVEKILIPDLPDKSVIVMDNAAFHKSKKTKVLLESKGHIIEFLPPYSPDFNPIENKWAQAKSIRRKLGCNVEEAFKSHMP
tara:strand:+ start:398 stop:883 length:486 start_codon:yes stop_codon:yes gene_type:complete